MRGPAAALFLAAFTVLALPARAPAQSGTSNLPVSLERIRQALNEPPPRLQASPPSSEMPTFRVEVHEPLVNLEPLDEAPFDPTWGLPSAGQLMMGGVAKIGSAMADYKKRRTQRRARKEVQDALTAFCAVHECEAPAGK